jgi:hypothetical protein
MRPVCNAIVWCIWSMWYVQLCYTQHALYAMQRAIGHMCICCIGSSVLEDYMSSDKYYASQSSAALRINPYDMLI